MSDVKRKIIHALADLNEVSADRARDAMPRDCWNHQGPHSDTEDACFDCGRALCGWHRSWRPKAMRGKMCLVPVCHPTCSSEWWSK